MPRLSEVSVETAQLDRVAWAGGIAFTSHGARIGIRYSHAAVLEPLLARLPPSWRRSFSPAVDELFSVVVRDPGSGGPDCHRLLRGGTVLATTAGLAELLDELESALHFSVATAARRRLFVHAGVVGWSGQAIVIPGRTHTGKTSLVEALVLAGATYYSDEYAVLDGQGRVHPYPKPLNLRRAPRTRGEPVRVEEIGGRSGSGPLPVGLVVVTSHRPGARWRPRTLAAGETVLALMDNTLVARTRPAYALGILRRVAISAVGLQGRRGEGRLMVPALLHRLPLAVDREI
jgi:hypothetical protein